MKFKSDGTPDNSKPGLEKGAKKFGSFSNASVGEICEGTKISFDGIEGVVVGRSIGSRFAHVRLKDGSDMDVQVRSLKVLENDAPRKYKVGDTVHMTKEKQDKSLWRGETMSFKVIDVYEPGRQYDYQIQSQESNKGSSEVKESEITNSVDNGTAPRTSKKCPECDGPVVATEGVSGSNSQYTCKRCAQDFDSSELKNGTAFPEQEPYGAGMGAAETGQNTPGPAENSDDKCDKCGHSRTSTFSVSLGNVCSETGCRCKHEPQKKNAGPRDTFHCQHCKFETTSKAEANSHESDEGHQMNEREFNNEDSSNLGYQSAQKTTTAKRSDYENSCPGGCLHWTADGICKKCGGHWYDPMLEPQKKNSEPKKCPECGGNLKPQGDSFTCDKCGNNFGKEKWSSKNTMDNMKSQCQACGHQSPNEWAGKCESCGVKNAKDVAGKEVTKPTQINYCRRTVTKDGKEDFCGKPLKKFGSSNPNNWCDECIARGLWAAKNLKNGSPEAMLDVGDEFEFKGNLHTVKEVTVNGYKTDRGFIAFEKLHPDAYEASLSNANAPKASVSSGNSNGTKMFYLITEDGWDSGYFKTEQEARDAAKKNGYVLENTLSNGQGATCQSCGKWTDDAYKRVWDPGFLCKSCVKKGKNSLSNAGHYASEVWETSDQISRMRMLTDAGCDPNEADKKWLDLSEDIHGMLQARDDKNQVGALSNDTGSFKVECLECNKKFSTASMDPTCPGCGGSDIAERQNAGGKAYHWDSRAGKACGGELEKISNPEPMRAMYKCKKCGKEVIGDDEIRYENASPGKCKECGYGLSETDDTYGECVNPRCSLGKRNNAGPETCAKCSKPIESTPEERDGKMYHTQCAPKENSGPDEYKCSDCGKDFDSTDPFDKLKCPYCGSADILENSLNNAEGKQKTFVFVGDESGPAEEEVEYKAKDEQAAWQQMSSDFGTPIADMKQMGIKLKKVLENHCGYCGKENAEEHREMGRCDVCGQEDHRALAVPGGYLCRECEKSGKRKNAVENTNTKRCPECDDESGLQDLGEAQGDHLYRCKKCGVELREGELYNAPKKDLHKPSDFSSEPEPEEEFLRENLSNTKGLKKGASKYGGK